ncbi:hypothetical protein GCM10027521_56270 [Amycolatopsis cihanbeyliensis]
MDHDPFAVRRAGPRAASAAGAFALGWGVLTVPAADAAGPAMFPSTCDTPSLVRAISAANDAGGPATVRLAGNCTYLLTEPTASGGNGADGLPVITGDVTMRGTDTTIARATRAPRFRVLEIAPAAALSLDGITISGGHTAGGGTPGAPGADGGGIRNAGTLTLHRSVLTGNRTGSGADGSDGAPGADGGEAGQPGGWGARGGRGGGIYNAGGTVTLRESLVSHNRTGRGGAGGDGGHGGHGAAGGDGGYGGRGAAGGSGAGLGGSGGTVTITSSVFAHNRTGDGGPTGSGGDGGDGTTGEGGDGGKAGNGRTSASGGPPGGIAAAGPLTVSGSMVYRNATGDGGDSGQAGHGGDGVTGGSGAGVWGGRAATQAGSGGDGGGIFTQRAYPTRIENSTVARNRTGDGGNGGDGGRGGNGERADGLAGSGAVGGWGGHGGGIGFGSGPNPPRCSPRPRSGTTAPAVVETAATRAVAGSRSARATAAADGTAATAVACTSTASAGWPSTVAPSPATSPAPAAGSAPHRTRTGEQAGPGRGASAAGSAQDGTCPTTPRSGCPAALQCTPTNLRTATRSSPAAGDAGH